MTVGTAPSPILALDGLSKRFGSLIVADKLSLSVTKGEVVGVIGPNGAGKTTLFNMISGDVVPDSGRVAFAGRDITNDPPYVRSRGGIGRTYQIPHPFTGLSVYENALVGASYGGARSGSPHGSVERALDITGLKSKAQRIAGTLGLLDRKRLELARALATDPDVLLLDEIAGGLTEREVHSLIATIQDLKGESLTIIWIEHVMHALHAVVSRLVCMNLGAILVEGAPADVMSDRLVRQVYLGLEVA
jgi:branched-chain amino acid transport system ATP-binding protein